MPAKEKHTLTPPQHEAINRLRPFAITYSLLSLPRILGIIRSKGSLSTRLRLVLFAILKPKLSVFKLAAFPTILPLLYQTIRPYVDSEYASEITAFICSPATLLLPHGLRVYFALYTVTSALTTFLKSASPKDLEARAAEGKSTKDWRDYLPPVTLINAIGNSWMVWSWYHEKGVFPKSYEKLIIDHSPDYCPPNRPPFEIRDFMETTLNPKIPNPTPGGHQYLVCQTLHPNEPSCIKNYITAWAREAPIVSRWVGGFGALSTLMQFKERILSDPIGALRAWVDYTIRGTLYVTGSVQTVWAVACLLQRAIPGDFIPKARWVINGSIASLWVLALPPKRQSEISVYVGRIGALSVWRAWLKHGGWSVKYGELLIFAFGWSFLLQLRKGGWRIEGLMRRTIKFIEGKPLDKPSSPLSPPPSEVPTPGYATPLKPVLSTSNISISDSGFASGDDHGDIQLVESTEAVSEN